MRTRTILNVVENEEDRNHHGQPRHHVYVGNTDFWLDTLELVELYKKLGHVKL